LHLEIPEEELQRRMEAWQPPDFLQRGYVQLYQQHVSQADLGADMDFLAGGSGDEVTRDSH
jgi:dihydroxy-acid dehydratase